MMCGTPSTVRQWHKVILNTISRSARVPYEYSLFVLEMAQRDSHQSKSQSYAYSTVHRPMYSYSYNCRYVFILCVLLQRIYNSGTGCKTMLSYEHPVYNFQPPRALRNNARRRALFKHLVVP
jgi:hypothetical protein